MNITTENRMAGIPIALFPASAFLLGAYAKADTDATEASYKAKANKAKCASCHGADGKDKEALKTRDFASAAVPSTYCGHHRWKRQDAGMWQEPRAGSG
jgi:cytochrome c553